MTIYISLRRYKRLFRELLTSTRSHLRLCDVATQLTKQIVARHRIPCVSYVVYVRVPRNGLSKHGVRPHLALGRFKFDPQGTTYMGKDWGYFKTERQRQSVGIRGRKYWENWHKGVIRMSVIFNFRRRVCYQSKGRWVMHLAGQINTNAKFRSGNSVETDERP